MAAPRYMHPICKTYEEVKRSRERMVGVKLNFVSPDDMLLQQKAEAIIEKLDEVIALIPEEFHKTRHELRKEEE